MYLLQKLRRKNFYYKLDQILVARSMKNFSRMCLNNTKRVPTREYFTRYMQLHVSIILYNPEFENHFLSAMYKPMLLLDMGHKTLTI
jgi:hypothetical protein